MPTLAPLLLVLLVLIGVAFMLVAETRPLVVTVSEEGFAVGGWMFRARVSWADVREISLADRLPRILLRTNGFSAFGRLRGRFSVAELGSGQVFADAKAAPFIVVSTKGSFVVLNRGEKRKTEELYAELLRRSKGRL